MSLQALDLVQGEIDLKSLREVLRFRTERFFEGAVQANWFYDPEKRSQVARAFVFHGPSYYYHAMGEDDTIRAQGPLVDTCTFTQLLTERLYSDQDDNPMLLAVAGYGSGKSHLAVTLASLFGSAADDPLRTEILANMQSSDQAIAESIRNSLGRPNLVIALNGMQDFNLTYGVLDAARATLRMHGLDDSPLKRISRASQIAETFVRNNFRLWYEVFEEAAAAAEIVHREDDLFEFLTTQLERDPLAFEIINHVYEEVNGVQIRWDDGISLDQILIRLYESFCGDQGFFNRILILFDEFGRFIEYAAEYPSRAGQAGLQQVYEALQNLSGGAQFVGFIQSDLRSYLARVNKDASIMRFIGRYESSRRLYLSSNLETIFANLIERTDSASFSELIAQPQQRSIDAWRSVHENLLKWIPDLERRSLWRDWDGFSRVVLEGTYPLHPITTYLLSTMSDWLQQRSALTFLHNEFENLGERTVDGSTELPLILPTRIVQSDFSVELLRAEEEGRQQSEYCVLYNSILAKHGDKCTPMMLDVLAANVVLRVGKFCTTSREDVVKALSMCTSHSLDAVTQAVYELENEIGVLAFDENRGCLDFVEDAVGARDFRRVLSRYRNRISDLDVPLLLTRVESVVEDIMQSVTTSFGTKNMIKTQEWDCPQLLHHIAALDENTIKELKGKWSKALSPDQPKGFVVWAYLGPHDDQAHLRRLQELIRVYDLMNTPILFFLLDDSEGKLFGAMRDLVMPDHMSYEDQTRFASFMDRFRREVETSIKDTCTVLCASRLEITPDCVLRRNDRLQTLCENRFAAVYPRIISFPFDEFSNKNTAPARRLLIHIARELLYSRIDSVSIQTYSSKIRNRIEAVLSSRSRGGWGIFDDELELQRPEAKAVRAIFGELDDVFLDNGSLSLGEFFERYSRPPYGISDYAISLLLACYIAYQSSSAKLSIDGKVMKTKDWASSVYEDKGVNFELLRKTVIDRVDEQEYAIKYERVCSLIEKAEHVGEILKYCQQLEALLSEEDPPESLRYRVEGCQGLARRAEHFQKEVTRLLEKQHERLHRGKETNSMWHLLVLIDECENRHASLGEGGQLRCTPKDEVEFTKLAQTARKHIEDHFDKWLNALKCDSVSQVSTFEHQTKNTISKLRDAGYDELAARLREKLRLIVDNMDHIRLLQGIRERTEAYLDQCRPSPVSTYEQLTEWKQRGKELIEHLSSDVRLKPSEVAAYKQRIEAKSKLVEQELFAIQEDVSQVYDSVSQLTTLDDCRSVLSQARALLSRNLHQVDTVELTNIVKVLSEFMTSVSQLNSLRQDRVFITKEIEVYRRQWVENPAGIDFSDVLDSIWSDIQRNLDESDLKWQLEFLSVEPTAIDSWTSERCAEWLSRTDAIPTFASEATRLKVHTLRDAARKRLSGLKVEAVIELFLRLDDNQKRECLEKLSAILADSNSWRPDATA